MCIFLRDGEGLLLEREDSGFHPRPAAAAAFLCQKKSKVRVPVCLRHAEVKRGEAELVRVAHRNGCGFDVV